MIVLEILKSEKNAAMKVWAIAAAEICDKKLHSRKFYWKLAGR